MSDSVGKECSSQPTSPRPISPPPAPTSTMSGWLYSPRALIATFLSLLFAALVFHPDVHRLLVRSENPDGPLNHVRNFYVWSRRNPKEERQVKIGSQVSLTALHFYPRKTYIIIHGFLGSGTDEWILSLKDALLHREDCNVISVNWSAGVVTAEYYLINPRVVGVGEDVGRLVTFLVDMGGLSLPLVHIIGHSLGAHAAGFVGKRFNGSLKRITGLDPAGHMFHNQEGTSRLHSSDAKFVDVIHTHGCTTILNQWSDCYGIDENIGDADFWPNGGERQPACEDGGDGPASVKDGSSCDHGMSYVLYTESVRYPPSTTHFRARPCPSWDVYNGGFCSCGAPAQYMGYNVNPQMLGTFYLNTSNNTPFGQLDPQCSAGAFSALQLVGLVLLVVALVLLLVVAVMAIAQLYLGVPVMAVIGFKGRVWLRRSDSSSKILTSASDTHLIT